MERTWAQAQAISDHKRGTITSTRDKLSLGFKFATAAGSAPTNTCGERDEVEGSLLPWSLRVQPWDNGARAQISGTLHSSKDSPSLTTHSSRPVLRASSVPGPVLVLRIGGEEPEMGGLTTWV